MKSLLPALVVILLLAHLVTGNWYVRKCANTLGNCRKTCRDGEQKTVPATGMCPKGKDCCVLDFKVSGQCGGSGTKGSEESGDQAGGGGSEPGAGAEAGENGATTAATPASTAAA